MINRKYLDMRMFGARRADPEDFDPNAWKRELRTAKEIMRRLKRQPGVLLADDTGLGKTWVAALAALAIGINGGRVLVLVPNKTMISKWEKDLYKVRSLLWDDSPVRIRLDARRIREKNIALATHHQFFQDNFPNATADLLIVDEAHRSKGDESMFRKKLKGQHKNFQGFLFLTATPFSISVKELISIINLVADENDAKRESIKAFAKFAIEVQKGECNKDIDGAEECWNCAVSELKPWVIRHTIANLGRDEKKIFGKRIDWEIIVPPADEKNIEILVRVDRLLNMKGGAKEINGIRGSDPRFHVGWYYLRHLLADDLRKMDTQNKLPEVLKEKNECVLKHVKNVGVIGKHHIHEIREKLKKIDQHPKVNAVVDEVARRVVEDREKVVVFCHHIATMHEVADALVKNIKPTANLQKRNGRAFKKLWSDVWNNLLEKDPYLKDKGELRQAVLKWTVCPAFRRQVASWLPLNKLESEKDLKDALRTTPVHGMTNNKVPSILKAVLELAHPERHLLNNTENKEKEDEKETTPKIFDHIHTPWDPVTTAQSEDLDAQIALFNTPFGPDVLVATDRLSEGIDLHKCCRLLVHYEFDPSPIRIRQREGRIRRIKGWAQRIGEPIEYAYPIFSKTRDELLVRIVKDRLERFDLLLGGASNVDIDNIDNEAGRNPDTNLLELLKKRIGDDAVKCLAVYC